MLTRIHPVWVVAGKEIRDVRRDLKSLQVLFFYRCLWWLVSSPCASSHFP